MADMSSKEIEKQKGLLHGEEHKTSEGTSFMLTEDRKALKLPAHVDWRKAGKHAVNGGVIQRRLGNLASLLALFFHTYIYKSSNTILKTFD